jgi:hypothetical protein
MHQTSSASARTSSLSDSISFPFCSFNLVFGQIVLPVLPSGWSQALRFVSGDPTLHHDVTSCPNFENRHQSSDVVDTACRSNSGFGATYAGEFNAAINYVEFPIAVIRALNDPRSFVMLAVGVRS